MFLKYEKLKFRKKKPQRYLSKAIISWYNFHFLISDNLAPSYKGHRNSPFFQDAPE